ncbi:hypothetical protein B296_00043918 [Ensete ventricosum]|uniref:Uncharacterized protein n=1 Tax=Ensete ventricosum TaxID=4639 RepID=A0A426WX93_ENSVE|nr:hypothetical protein B296_00043918 [Ensete ventricosum]
MKKHDGHKFCPKSPQCRVSISFSVTCRVEFRSIFRVLSRKIKILAIPDVLAPESSFDRFFVHCLKNSFSP